jgi:hypothetical protein
MADSRNSCRVRYVDGGLRWDRLDGLPLCIDVAKCPPSSLEIRDKLAERLLCRWPLPGVVGGGYRERLEDRLLEVSLPRGLVIISYLYHVNGRWDASPTL